MSRRIPCPSSELIKMVSDYRECKDESKILDEKISNLNNDIKTSIKNEKLPDEFDCGELKVSVSVRENYSFNDIQAIDILKSNLADSPDLLAKVVKQKDYIDDDELESAIYNGLIPGELLQPCNERKPDIVTLRITKKRGSKKK